MEGQKIIHVGTPTEETDAANKIYVDRSLALMTITDNGFSRLRNLREPKVYLDAVNKGYTDSNDDLLRQSINSISTNINYLEDFIFSKGYIKKVTLNEEATNIPLRSVAKLVGVEVSGRHELELFISINCVFKIV